MCRAVLTQADSRDQDSLAVAPRSSQPEGTDFKQIRGIPRSQC